MAVSSAALSAAQKAVAGGVKNLAFASGKNITRDAALAAVQKLAGGTAAAGLGAAALAATKKTADRIAAEKAKENAMGGLGEFADKIKSALSGGTAAAGTASSFGGGDVPTYQEYLDDSGYDDYKQSVTDAIRAQTDAAVDNYKAQIADAQDEEERLAREAYVQKMQSQRNLGQQLTAAGYSGGMADSERIAVENAYQQALADIQNQRMKDVDAIERAITQAQLAGESDLNGYLSDYQQRAADSYRNYVLDMQQSARSYQQQAQARAYEQVMSYLQMGIMPGDSELAAAGIDPTVASLIVGKVNGTASGTGGYSGGGYTGYDNGGLTTEEIKRIQRAAGMTGADVDGLWGPATTAAVGASASDYAAALRAAQTEAVANNISGPLSYLYAASRR